MDNAAPALEVGFEINPTGSFAALGQLETAMGAAEASVLADAKRIEQATGRPPVGLCDYTGAMIQSQEVINALTRLMETPVVRSRRVAMYTSYVMPKMQAERATRNRPEFRFFTDKDEAREWLFADQDAMAAA